MCWSQTNTYRYIQHHSVPAKTKWEIQSINWLHYKLKTKKQKKEEGERWESGKKNPTCDGLIKAFLKKERNAYCTYSESLNSTRSASFSLKREFKKNFPLGGRHTEVQKKKEKERKKVCVCAFVCKVGRGHKELIWGRSGTLRGRRGRKLHSTRHGNIKRENVAQIKSGVG